jgi:HTH-type transcriptional regulator/antitoxin MqsA
MTNPFKALRLAAGLTQQQVADGVGAKSQAVSGWERGLAAPHARHWESLAKLFGVSLSKIARAVIEVSTQNKNTATPPGRSGAKGVSPEPQPVRHETAGD